jgi:predicted nucleotidyltransferase
MVEESILNIAKEYLTKVKMEFLVEDAYIFGSFAKNSNHLDSDIDIAIILKNIDDFFDIQLKLMRLRREIDLRIEAHPIELSDFNSSNFIFQDIQKNGILIN